MRRVVRRSYRRPGRLIPKRSRGLRARSMLLPPEASVAWHSTGAREELLIGLAGEVLVEIRRARRVRRVALAAGWSLWLPPSLPHRVINASTTPVRYLYVTGR